MKDVRYEAVRTYFTTDNAPDGLWLEWALNYERSNKLRERRGRAISDGFEAWGNDDFNIAVWKGSELVSWDWMDETIEGVDGLAERRRGLAEGKTTNERPCEPACEPAD